MGRILRKRRNHVPCTKKNKKKNMRRQFVNPKLVQDEALRKQWDNSRTLKENLTAKTVKELYWDSLPAEIPKEGKHPIKLNEEELPIITQLVEKHGDDYDKMHWDIKINIFQWTKAEIKKRVEAYKQGKVRSMAAEIFSGHGQDLRKPVFGAAKLRNVFGH
mmetsp:Transcript_79743/g.157974  ORF Transcript_79743/g.157974 Transcript_79743/m.157974 type:complete len:161 (+) Transcript_79743:52-534(+)